MAFYTEKNKIVAMDFPVLSADAALAVIDGPCPPTLERWETITDLWKAHEQDEALWRERVGSKDIIVKKEGWHMWDKYCIGAWIEEREAVTYRTLKNRLHVLWMSILKFLL